MGCVVGSISREGSFEVAGGLELEAMSKAKVVRKVLISSLKDA